MLPFPIVLAPFLSLTPAQQFESQLKINDLVTGRPVRAFERAAIDDDGSWSDVVRLDGLTQFLNGGLLRNGNLVFAEGQFLTQPSARVRYLGLLEGSGDNAAQNVILDSFAPPRAYTQAEAIMHRGTILLTDGEPVNVTGLPGTTLCTLIGATGANGNGTVMTVARINGVPLPAQAVLRFEFDANGNPLSRELVLQSRDVLPDGTIAWRFADVAIDETGKWLVGVTTQDQQQRLLAPNRIVLGTGSPSPLPGRSIVNITEQYDRNDFGGYAVYAQLDGDDATNGVLLKNGAILAQEGELVPSPEPGEPARTLHEIGNVRLSNAGNVYWQARIGAGSLQRGIFMRDRTPFLQAGTSMIDGELVTDYQDSLDNFDISPSGRFWVGRMVRETSGMTLVTADFGASRVLPGCNPNPGTLRHTEGLVLAGHTIRVVLDGPARPGSIATLSLSSALANPGSPCGQPSPFGEILIDPARVPFTLVAGVFAGGPVAVDLAIPANLALVNREFFAQGAFLRPGAMLTNGLSLEVGAP